MIGHPVFLGDFFRVPPEAIEAQVAINTPLLKDLRLVIGLSFPMIAPRRKLSLCGNSPSIIGTLPVARKHDEKALEETRTKRLILTILDENARAVRTGVASLDPVGAGGGIDKYRRHARATSMGVEK